MTPDNHWYEQDNATVVFCRYCGKQLFSIDEIKSQVCHPCSESRKKKGDDRIFFCWVCGKKLEEMSEIAQGVCHPCKSDIIRKLRPPVKKKASVDVSHG